MLKNKKIIFIILLSILMSIFYGATVCYANAAEPPSILIIVPDAPDDLEISINKGDTYIKADKRDNAFEKYFTFYLGSLKDLRETESYYTLKVSTGDINYDITIEIPVNKYNNIYTLDLKNGILIPGKSLSRSILLVSIRVILTLLIEGAVFWLFGFRNKRSWIAFFIINIITQGVLNIWINGLSPLHGYLIFGLVFLEILIIIVELIAFLIFVKEFKEYRARRVFYVIMANLLSLIAGGYIITVLPI